MTDDTVAELYNKHVRLGRRHIPYLLKVAESKQDTKIAESLAKDNPPLTVLIYPLFWTVVDRLESRYIVTVLQRNSLYFSFAYFIHVLLLCILHHLTPQTTQHGY